MAEEVRFELTEGLHPRQFSRVIFVILYNILRHATTINSTACRCKSFVRVRPMLPVFDSNCPTTVPSGTFRDSWFECQICGLSVGSRRGASTDFDFVNTGDARTKKPVLLAPDVVATPSPARPHPTIAPAIPLPSAGDTNQRAYAWGNFHGIAGRAHVHRPARGDHPTLSADRAARVSLGNTAPDRWHNLYRLDQTAIFPVSATDNISARPAHASARCAQSRYALRRNRDKSSWFSYAARIDYYAL